MDSPRRNTLVMAGKSFLLIGKSPHFLKTAEDRFHRMGINVTRSHTAKDGFQRASREKHDLVIMANSLPEMPASAFLELLRAQKKTKDLPALVAASPEEMDPARGSSIKGSWLDETMAPEEMVIRLEEIFLQRTLLAEGTGRVVAVDDSPIALKKYEMTLKDHGYEFRAVQDPNKAIETMMEFMPDLALMDQNMPERSGFELTRMILSQRGLDRIKIVMVTSDQKKETVLKALECGVVDFLTKPFDDEILLARIRAHISNKKLFDDLARAYEQLESLNERLESLSITDGLTHMKNHRWFVETLMGQMQAAEASGGRLCLALLDIDHFKKINDTHGHLAGDEALKAIAAILTNGSGHGASLARYGGEEFAILFPGVGLEEAIAATEGIRLAVQKTPLDLGRNQTSTTISAGVACWRQGMTADQLIADADKALYQSKSSGRNQVTAAPPEG